MHPQTLRQYDRLGLVVPGRTRGRGRRYSARDIEALREIQRLSVEEGVNLAGIKRILELTAEVRALRALVAADQRFFAVGPEGEATPLARGRRPQRRAAPGGAVPAADGGAAPRAGGTGGPGAGGAVSRAVIVWRPR
jgi:MerR family transcriptional regulator/heat shock protein HspR